jgi:hypothetical protein
VDWASWMNSAHEEKMISILPMYFPYNTEMKNLGTSENYENFPEGRLEYLAQLLYLAL